MLSNFISMGDWDPKKIGERDCLYGFSHKRYGFLPFKEIKEVINIRRGNKIGVKGLDEEGNKLYSQFSSKDQLIIKEKGWLKEFGF